MRRRRPRTAPGLALLCLAVLLAAAAGLPSGTAPPPEPGSGSGGPAEGSPGTVPPVRSRSTAAPTWGSASPPPPPPEEEEEEAAVAEEEEEEAAASSSPAGERPTRVRGGGRRQRGHRFAGERDGAAPSLQRADKDAAGGGIVVGAVGFGTTVPWAPSGCSGPVQGRRDPRGGTSGSISCPSPLCPVRDLGGCDPHAELGCGAGWSVWGFEGALAGQVH